MAGQSLVVCWGLAVWVSVRLNTNVHAAPLDHNTCVKCGFNRAAESQKRNVAGAAVFVLALDPLAFERLGLGFCKFHDQTSSVTVVARKTSRQISSISEA